MGMERREGDALRIEWLHMIGSLDVGGQGEGAVTSDR